MNYSLCTVPAMVFFVCVLCTPLCSIPYVHTLKVSTWTFTWTLYTHSALARFSARGGSRVVTRAALKYAFRSLFVIEDVSGQGVLDCASDGSDMGRASVAVLSASCAPCAHGMRNLWPPVPSARARARASERRL